MVLTFARRSIVNIQDGSTYAIVAIVLYIMTGMFHFLIYKQEINKANESEGAGVKEEVVEVGQDGDDEELQGGEKEEE
jgi:hypothetical protein